MFFGRFLAGTDRSHCPVKDVDQNSTRTFVSAHVPRAPDQGPALAGDGGSTFADHQKRPAGHPVCPARGPGCNGAPCEGDRADPCADSACLPSRPRTASKSSGLVVALSDPDGDPQLSHWHRSMSLGHVIDNGSRFDPAMPLSGSPSIKLLYGSKGRSASTKSVARCACLGVPREALAGRIWPYR